MSVWMWAFANHNIDFSKDSEDLIEYCLNVLESLHVTDKQWVLDQIDTEDVGYPEYTFMFGKHGTIDHLEIGICRNYLFFDTNCFPWVHWLDPFCEAEEQERDFIRDFIHKATKAFGGDTISYFPDNMFDCCLWMPSNNPQLTFKESLELLYANHKYIYLSLEESNKHDKDPGEPVILEHI